MWNVPPYTEPANKEVPRPTEVVDFGMVSRWRQFVLILINYAKIVLKENDFDDFLKILVPFKYFLQL
jgi:hypothetical protein